MHENQQFLPDILILLSAAVLVVALFRKFNLSPVLGYLAAGAAIGPFGFNLVSSSANNSYIAEYGVVFLLFVIGMELSFSALINMRAYVLGLGGLQIVITSIALALLIMNFTHDFNVALLVGCALALSSTAIVLPVLEERGDRLSQTGRVAFSVLLMQDLAVIPLLMFVSVLAGNGNGELLVKLQEIALSTVVVIPAIVVFAKFLLKPLLRLIASSKSSELFTATTLLVVLGSSFATQAAGLSNALGAFLAGLMVAETHFRKQVEADIMPFKSLLMGLFFMTIGMSFDFKTLFEILPAVLLCALSLIALKTFVTYCLCRSFKLGNVTSLKTALVLAQGSEFAFILFGLALSEKLIDQELYKLLILVITLTMALTPLIYAGVKRSAKRLLAGAKSEAEIVGNADLQNHIIICGFGWVGENLAKFFGQDNVSYVALDTEAKRVRAGREMGLPVFYGDASRVEILRALKADKAKAIAITIHDSKAEIRIIQVVKNAYPELPIIVRAKHVENIEQLKKEGADYVVPEAYESSIQIGKVSLRVLGADEDEIKRMTQAFRGQNSGFDDGVIRED